MLRQNVIGQRIPRTNAPAIAIVGLALLAAAAAGIGRLPIPSSVLLMGPVALAAVALVLRRMEYGVVLLTIVATAVPLQFSTGTQSNVVASLLFAALLIGLWVVQMLVRRRIVLVRSALNAPLFALMAVWILAYLNANATMHPLVQAWPGFATAQLGGLGVALLSFAVLLLVMNNLPELVWIRRLTWVFLGMGAVAIAGYALAPGPTYTYFDTRGLFVTWVVALAYGQALYNQELALWKRAGLLLLVAAWMYRHVIRHMDWLSGWVPGLVALLLITFFRSKRLFAVLVLALVLIAALNFDSVYTQYEARNSEGDALRLPLWAQALDLTAGYPLLGTGPAGYAVYYMTFYRNTDASMSSHSNLIDIVAQTGLLGSLAFAWFMAAMFMLCRRARRQWRSGFAAGFANGVYGCLVGVIVAMALGDWLIPFVYNQTIAGFRYTVHSWIFFGALASMEHFKET